jgi:hypothetical protein
MGGFKIPDGVELCLGALDEASSLLAYPFEPGRRDVHSVNSPQDKPGRALCRVFTPCTQIQEEQLQDHCNA